MATSKKATTKATATKKVTKKPVAKKTVITKKTASTAANTPFLQVRITDQSLYWALFGIAAVIFALWLYTLDAKVRDLYDQIDENNSNANSIIETRKAQQPKD